MVQQILDPNGTLQHVILTPEPMLSQHQPPPPPQSHPGVPITPYVSTEFGLFKRSWRARALLNLSLTPLLVSLLTPFGESFNPFW